MMDELALSVLAGQLGLRTLATHGTLLQVCVCVCVCVCGVGLHVCAGVQACMCVYACFALIGIAGSLTYHGIAQSN